ncbi:hypothetical protein V8D89_012020 [Ganoderma adspersum]
MTRPRVPSPAKSNVCTYPPCSTPVSDAFRCPTCNVARYCHFIHAFGSKGSSRQQTVEARKVDFLLFPVDATTPRIVQVDCRVRHKNEFSGEEDHNIDWQKLLGGFVPGITAHPIGPVKRRSRSAPPSRLFLAFDDRGPFDGPSLPANICTHHLTHGQSRPPWTGTLVGYRIREPAEKFTQFLDVSMADLLQFVIFLLNHGPPLQRGPSFRNVTPDEFLAMLARQVDHARSEVYSDFSSTAAQSVAREGIVPPEYPTTSCTMAQEELDTQNEVLEKVVREEVQAAIWETGITVAVVLVGTYALWLFVLSPSISFFPTVFIFFLRVPFALMKVLLWPLTLLKFALT